MSDECNWVHVDEGSPIGVMVRLIVVTEPNNIYSNTCRIFYLRYGWILKSKWVWEANPKLPLDIYKLICSKQTKALCWHNFYVNSYDAHPLCIELTKGREAVYWDV